MMYRTVDCDTWDDPWFADLEPTDKLLFLYLLTNRRSTAAGVFEITLRHMAFETGLTFKQVSEALPHLTPKIAWWPVLQVVWIRNFYKHQRANSNDKFAIAAAKALHEFPDDVCGQVLGAYEELHTVYTSLYGEVDTHPRPTPVAHNRDRGKETETETETDKEQEQEKDAGVDISPEASEDEEPIPLMDNFTRWFEEEFWRAYPKNKDGLKPQKEKARRAAKKLTVSQWEQVIVALAEYKRSSAVKAGAVKYPEGFLNPEFWRDHYEKALARPGGNSNGTTDGRGLQLSATGTDNTIPGFEHAEYYGDD